MMPYTRDISSTYFRLGKQESDRLRRGYVEWAISALFGMTVTKVEFRYHGKSNNIGFSDGSSIKPMASQPSAQTNNDAGNQVIYDDAGTGTLYHWTNSPPTFPEVGTGKDVGGSTGPAWTNDPTSDLQTAVDASQSWFGFGFKGGESSVGEGQVYSEEYGSVNPAPTLYVEYSIAAVVPGGSPLAQMIQAGLV